MRMEMEGEAAWTSERQEAMPVGSDGRRSRRWRRLVGLLRETWEINSLWESKRGSVPKKMIHATMPPTHSPCEGFSPVYSSSDENRGFSAESEEFFLQTWTEMCAGSFQAFSTDKNTSPPCWMWVVWSTWTTSKTLKIRLIVGSNVHPGPDSSAAYEGSSGRQTFWERKQKRWFLCSSLMLKYLSLALRTTGSTTRFSTGWFRPRQRWKSVWISDVFGFFSSFSRHENPQYRNPHGTVFPLWSIFLITEHKIAKNKKKSWNSNMTSGEHPTIWCFCLAFFLIAICLKSETGIFLLFFLFYFLDFFSTLYAYKQMLKCFTPCGSSGNRRLSVNHRTSRRESKGLWGLRPLWQSIHKEVEKEGGWDREGVWPQSKAAGNHAEWRAWHLDPNGLGRLAR